MWFSISGRRELSTIWFKNIWRPRASMPHSPWAVTCDYSAVLDDACKQSLLHSEFRGTTDFRSTTSQVAEVNHEARSPGAVARPGIAARCRFGPCSGREGADLPGDDRQRLDQGARIVHFG